MYYKDLDYMLNHIQTLDTDHQKNLVFFCIFSLLTFQETIFLALSEEKNIYSKTQENQYYDSTIFKWASSYTTAFFADEQNIFENNKFEDFIKSFDEHVLLNAFDLFYNNIDIIEDICIGQEKQERVDIIEDIKIAKYKLFKK